MISIPKGVKYTPMMVHTIGMLHKHTNNGMLAYRYMVCTDIDICNLYLYPCITII